MSSILESLSTEDKATFLATSEKLFNQIKKEQEELLKGKMDKKLSKHMALYFEVCVLIQTLGNNNPYYHYLKSLHPVLLQNQANKILMECLRILQIFLPRLNID